MNKNLGPFKDLRRELKQCCIATINRIIQSDTMQPFLTWQVTKIPAAFRSKNNKDQVYTGYVTQVWGG
jgi:hypothetical protein